MLKQGSMRLQPHHTAVAVPERVHPGQPVVSAGDCDQLRRKPAHRRVGLFDPLQERGHRSPIGRFVPAYIDVTAADIPGRHFVPLVGKAILLRQPAVETLVQAC